MRKPGIGVCATDAGYVLLGLLEDKHGFERMTSLPVLREVALGWTTLFCANLSEIAHYVQVTNAMYKVLKAHIPGAFTFILPALSSVPRRLQDAKKKTIGVRVSGALIMQALLAAFQQPLVGFELVGFDDVECLRPWVDFVITGGEGEQDFTTVVDLSTELPHVYRQGIGKF